MTVKGSNQRQRTRIDATKSAASSTENPSTSSSSDVVTSDDDTVQNAHDLYSQRSIIALGSAAATESENHGQESIDDLYSQRSATLGNTVHPVVLKPSEEEHVENEKDFESDYGDEEEKDVDMVDPPTMQNTHELYSQRSTTLGSVALPIVISADIVEAETGQGDASETEEVLLQIDENTALFKSWNNENNTAGVSAREEMEHTALPGGAMERDKVIKDSAQPFVQKSNNKRLSGKDAITSDSFATFDSVHGTMTMQDAHDIYQQRNATAAAEEVAIEITAHNVKQSGKEESQTNGSQTPINTDDASTLIGGDEDSEQDVRLTLEQAHVHYAPWSDTLESQEPIVVGIKTSAKESSMPTTDQSHGLNAQKTAALGSNINDYQDIGEPDDESYEEEWHAVLPPIREEGDIQVTDESRYEPYGDSVVPLHDVDEELHMLYEGGGIALVATVDYKSENSEMVAEERDASIARKFDCLPRRELQLLGLEDWRRKSTGSILGRPIKKDSQSNLKPIVSSLLDTTIDVNEETMEWRNSILKDHMENKEVVEAVLVLKSTSESLHPLHDGEDPQEQRLRISFLADDDVSVMSTDSTWSNWSSGSIYQSWFGASPQRRASLSPSTHKSSSSLISRNGSSPMKRNQRPSRRFIDLTVGGGEDDTEEDYYGDVLSDDSDDSSDTATSYSIPIQKTKKKDATRSIARQFLDLTDQNGDPPDPGQKAFRFSWRGTNRLSSIRHMSTRSDLNDSLSDTSQLQLEEEEDGTIGEDCDYDDVALYSTAAWEAADAAFIENVKDIATNLERTLNDKGLESPYWAAEEIIPTFKALHSKVKESMDRLKKESEIAPVPLTPVATTNSNVGSSSGGKRVRLSRRKLSEFGEIGGRTLKLPDDLGGYDDLGMRTLHRDDRAYLKQFLYDYRRDGTCSLPLVLASGLEKRLCDTTIDAALGILSKLTSPLRRRRCEMATVQEEGEDGSLRDGSSWSQRSRGSKSVFETLD